MHRRPCCIALFLCGILLTLTAVPGAIATAHADAAGAMAAIEAVVDQIHGDVVDIRNLARQKQLDTAMVRLEQLNRFIMDHLGDTFFDGVRDVRREYPGYTPPAVDLTLGPAFTAAYWQNKIATAEQACRNAVDGLAGLAANRTLATQDEIWAYLKAAKAGFDGVKDVAEDIISANPFKLVWDFYNLCNTFTEQYTAINNAIQAGRDIEVMAAQIRTLIARAEQNLERMQDLNSTLTVYYREVQQLELHRRNIDVYVHRAVTDPVCPFDFSNTAYNFDPTPYVAAVRAAEADFSSGEYCWTPFDASYHANRSEAQETYDRIAANITASSDPEGTKAAYRTTNAAQWDYFITEAAALYDPHLEQWQSVQDRYAELQGDIAALTTARTDALDRFWVADGPASPTLRTFAEEDHGIVQINLPGSDSDPYYQARQYAPWFPTAAGDTLEMPAELPAMFTVGLDGYPQLIGELAGAYRGMAAAGVVQPTTLTLGSGAPAGYFAVSPLTADLLDDVDHNLTLIDAHLDDYAAFMATKTPHLQAAETAQADILAAQQALVDFVADHRPYLCLDAPTLAGDHVRQWADLITPVYALAVGYVGDVADARGAVDEARAYIDGQNDFNDALAGSDDLLADLRQRDALNTVIRFIVSDYIALPAVPSEQGYLDFIRQIEYLQAFYGPADLDRAMDLRQEAIDLFRQIFHSPAAASLPGTLVTNVPWLRSENPFCVLPANVARLQDLVAAVRGWDDRFIPTVRDGFPGWIAWARQRLAADWPDTQTDDVPPEVVHVSPARGSVGVGLYPLIDIYFNEAMDDTTITASTVALSANGKRRNLQLVYDRGASRLTLDPAGLLPDTVYTVDLGAGLTDAAGNAISPDSWSFATMATDTPDPPPRIVITGVAEGRTYAEPVTVGISVTSGGFDASLSRDGEPAQAILDGHRVSLPGAYRLRVVSDGADAVSRSLAFVVGTGTDDYEMAPQTSLVYLAERGDSSYGNTFRVYGQRYFYQYGPVVKLHDMLTGEIRELFQSGYVYNAPAGGNDEYAFLLDVHGDLVLYFKNIGTEGEGVEPEDKLFQLFVHDIAAGVDTAVPTPAGVSIRQACLRYDAVVWADDHSGVPAVYHWTVGDRAPRQIAAFDNLEAWQQLEVLDFDGQWVVFNLDDGTRQTCYDTAPGHGGNDICKPFGDRLAAVHIETGREVVLAQGAPDQPLEVASAEVCRGLAAYAVYVGYRDLTLPYGPEIVETAWLYLRDLSSGLPMVVSRQPEVRIPVQMSESLLYFAQRTVPPPYNLSAGLYFYQYDEKLHDLFSHREQIVDFGNDTITRGRVQLSGNRLVSNQDPPRVIQYGLPLSPAVATDRSPAPDAVDVSVAATVDIGWSVPMDPATLTDERVALSRLDDTGTFVERAAVVIQYDDALDTVTLTPAEPMGSGARYRVYVDGTVQDAQGGALVKPLQWFFTTSDVTGPVLTASVPAEGSRAMLTTAAITLTFDEALDQTSLAAGILLWRGETAAAVTVSGDGDGCVTVRPDQPLAPDTAYAIEVTAALADTHGNPRDASHRVAFRTAADGSVRLNGRLAYGASSAVRVSTNGGTWSSLISNLFGVNALRWDATGDRLIYASPNGFVTADLNARDMSNGSIATLTANVAQVPAFDLSPNGDTVYYVTPRPGMTGCQVVADDPAGGSPSVSFEMTEHTITALQVSPDATRLVMTVDRGYVDPPQVGVLELATGNSLFVNGLRHAAWSDDGASLFVAGTLEGRDAVAVFNPDLSGLRVLRRMPVGPLFPSRSGHLLAVLAVGGIQLVDPTDGRLRGTIVCRAGDMGDRRVVWAGDDTALVFGHVTGDGTSQICHFDLAANRVTVLAEYTINGMPSTVFDWQTAVADLPPLVPLAVSDASADGTSRVLLDWQDFDVPAGVTTFRIYRDTRPFSVVTGMKVVATTAARQYTDVLPAGGTPVYYAVVAVTDAGGWNPNARATGPVIPGDGDTLDNDWEMRHWGHLNILPDGDEDADGLTNRREQEEYTDPREADSDGDGAADGAEVAAGFDPLAADVAPLTIVPPDGRLRVGNTQLLGASGGSGEYLWTSLHPQTVTVNGQGQVSGITPGPGTVMLSDARFTDLPAVQIVLDVGEPGLRLDPAGATRLQPSGHLDLRVSGGSGLYRWQIPGDALIQAIDFGSRCRLVSLAPNGTFHLAVSDAIDPDLPGTALDVTIAPVVGDVDGDSRVAMPDVVLLLGIQAGREGLPEPCLEGDVTGDGTLDTADAPYVLNAVGAE